MCASSHPPASGRASTSKAISGNGLRLAGVGRVEVMPHDTCADEERFFSYRRTTLRGEDRFGLQLSAIVLEG